jgi:hypothetical protein
MGRRRPMLVVQCVRRLSDAVRLNGTSQSSRFSPDTVGQAREGLNAVMVGADQVRANHRVRQHELATARAGDEARRDVLRRWP